MFPHHLIHIYRSTPQCMHDLRVAAANSANFWCVSPDSMCSGPMDPPSLSCLISSDIFKYRFYPISVILNFSLLNYRLLPPRSHVICDFSLLYPIAFVPNSKPGSPRSSPSCISPAECDRGAMHSPPISPTPHTGHTCRYLHHIHARTHFSVRLVHDPRAKRRKRRRGKRKLRMVFVRGDITYTCTCMHRPVRPSTPCTPSRGANTSTDSSPSNCLD